MRNYLEALASLWAHEPVVIVGLVDAGIMLIVALGVPVSTELKVAIDTFLGAAGVVILRSTVYSPATHEDETGTAHLMGFMDAWQGNADQMPAEVAHDAVYAYNALVEKHGIAAK